MNAKLVEYAIGSIVLSGTVDETTGEARYIAHGTGGVNSGPCGSIAEALLRLGAVLSTCPDPQVNRPLKPQSVMAPDPVQTLVQATVEELRDARGVSAPSARLPSGEFTQLPKRAYSTVVGEAILAIAALPPSLRGYYLKGTGITVKGAPPNDTDRWLVTVTRAGKRFRYLIVPSDIKTADGGGRVLCECAGYMLVPEIGWERLGLDPEAPSAAAKAAREVEEGPKMLRPFGQMIDEFCAVARTDFEHLPAATRESGQDRGVAPLLAYACGMVRWLIANQLNHVAGTPMHNPWYALGIALAGIYGLDTADATFGFGMSAFDKMVAMTPASETDGTVAYPVKPTSGVN